MERISRLAREVGPACASVAADEELPGRVSERIAGGASFEDAVLGALFPHSGERPEVGAEIVAYVMSDIAHAHSRAVPARLRHVAAPSDIAQSVLGDLCASLAGLEYTTKAGFLALLGSRLRWKRLDYEKRLTCDRRREDLRVHDESHVLRRSGADPSPMTELVSMEEASRIALAIQRLPERDRDVLRMSLRGQSHESIGAVMGLSAAGSRKALERARARLKELLGAVEEA
jgi:RNA polymerase sigma factor (sigma-70 family)